MNHVCAGALLFQAPWGKVLLLGHLVVAAITLGAVTHHWWELTLTRRVRPLRLRRYAKWAAITYVLAFVGGSILYPTYNLVVRRVPEVGLDATAPWAVSLFEYKEHFGTFALVMLPWLVIGARRFEQLAPCERLSFRAAAWAFTLFVWYVFVTGGLVTALKAVQ